MIDRDTPPDCGSQMISDIGERSIRRLPSSRDDRDYGEAPPRFDTISTSAIRTSADKKTDTVEPEKTAEGTKNKPREMMGGENYQKIYQQLQNDKLNEEQARLKSAQKNKDFIEKAARDEKMKKENEKKESDKKFYEKQEEDNQRFRAKELQNQISYWEQQKGQGQHSESVCDTTVDNLKRELSGIPSWLQRN